MDRLNNITAFYVLGPLSVAVKLVSETGFPGARIAGIAATVGLTGAGANLVYQAYKKDTSFQTVQRFGFATLGLMISSLGVYNIVTTLLSFSPPEPKLSCEGQLEQLVTHLNSCPPVAQLWEKLNQEAPINLDCCSIGEGFQISLPYRGLCLVTEEFKVREEAVLGLQTLDRFQDYAELGANICKKSRTDFLQDVETLERSVFGHTYDMIQQCAEEGNWEDQSHLPGGIYQSSQLFFSQSYTEESIAARLAAASTHWLRYCSKRFKEL